MHLSSFGNSIVRALLLVVISATFVACGDRGGSGNGDGDATPNTPPEADAGAPQVVTSGTLVTLDASGSTDEDGDTLSFSWEQTSGSAVTLDAATFATTTFTAPAVSGLSESLTFRVEVSDGTDKSTADVTVVVQNDTGAILPPISAAGANQTVNANDTVSLDGSDSLDPNDRPLSYTWSQRDGPPVTLSATDTPVATFTAPSFPRNTPLTFALTVSNGFFNDVDVVVITVNADPDTLTPTANAGRNQTVTAGDPVTLDGTASSDPSDLDLSYSWVQISGDPVALAGEDQAIASFTAPAVTEQALLRFRLTVSNGDFEDFDNVLVTVNPLPDTDPPTILTRSPEPDATEVLRSATVTVGFDEPLLQESINATTFKLRRGTSDTVGTIDYDGSTNVLTFTPAANLAANRVYTVVLDGITDLAGNPVAVTEWNFTTSANAGPTVVVTDSDQFVTRGATAELDASGSTDDLTPAGQLQFDWTQIAGTPVALSNPGAANPSFATDSLDVETLIFTVTVTDGDDLPSTSGNVYVTVLEDTNALFVSTAGADGNTGTRTAPFRSISRALTVASGVSPRPDIYVTSGSYLELSTLSIISGVSIYGSFDASFRRVLEQIFVPATVITGAATAVAAVNITASTSIDLVDIRSSAATTAGFSSIGLAVTDSDGGADGLIVSRSIISAGNGANGVDGVIGSDGSDGVNGSNGADGTGGEGGAGGPASTGRCGVGAAGAGGAGSQVGSGEDGFASEDGVDGGAGGAESNDDPAARNGEPGDAVTAILPTGDSGAAGSASGSVSGSTWIPAFGGDGNNGEGGASGGGGGGGAGFDDRGGGGGGSGGAGGCAGEGGTGGQGGSGSFALVLANSAADIQGSFLVTGNGGVGGDGSAGGSGGDGGTGGTGGAGRLEAGNGGNGGAGQAGSAGGAGGVGAGGPSIGILLLSGSSLLNTSGTTFSLGAPGSAGTPALGAPAGEEGLSQNTFVLIED